jgi:Ni/Fe-hydrogenase subunit HybB-like protein
MNRPASFALRTGATWSFLRQELRPKGSIWTPFNLITGTILLAAIVILSIRFATGLASVSNLNQEYPWGVWKGFNVVAGVALAGGAYVLTFVVYILGLRKYEPILRVTVLNGFLAYVFYAGALLLDLGRPWKVFNPIIGNSFGLTSVLFLVAWHFLLYMMAELIEFSPAIAEWLGKERARRILKGMAVGAVILGISLSTLHQSGLGALFLMAKPKIHPLWYSEFIPILFFISSIFAGISMVIVEGSISTRVFRERVGSELEHSHESILRGLSRIAGVVMVVYLFLQGINFVHGQLWRELHGFYGAWYLFELIGLVLLPMWLLLRGTVAHSLAPLRIGAALAIAGVILNRLNVSVIGFKWYESARYVPSWMELVVLVAVICAEIWVFRWVVRRLPVLAPISELPSRASLDAEEVRS